MKKPPDELAKEYADSNYIAQRDGWISVPECTLPNAMQMGYKAGYQAGHSQGYEDCREDAVKVCENMISISIPFTDLIELICAMKRNIQSLAPQCKVIETIKGDGDEANNK